MPPGGSSAGLAFEDAIILSRILESASPDIRSIDEAFSRYDAIRRPRVTEHYKQMASRWEGTKNRSWLVQKVREFFVWAMLGFIAKHNDANFGYDPMKVSL
jgi:salicylate hydroxylase